MRRHDLFPGKRGGTRDQRMLPSGEDEQHEAGGDDHIDLDIDYGVCDSVGISHDNDDDHMTLQDEVYKHILHDMGHHSQPLNRTFQVCRSIRTIIRNIYGRLSEDPAYLEQLCDIDFATSDYMLKK